MQSHDWRRYVAPAAFLAAVTVAVVLVRAGLESGGTSATTAATTTVLVKRYYRVHAGLNPTQVVPAGPDPSGWLAPHDRQELGGRPFGDGTPPGPPPEAERVPPAHGAG